MRTTEKSETKRTKSLKHGGEEEAEERRENHIKNLAAG
jgi:hypothetical protein